MKKTVFLASFVGLITICPISYANDIIFKCVDQRDGSVTYLNIANVTPGKCKATELGKVDKLSTVSSADRKFKSSTVNTGSVTVTLDNDQIFRDAKRELILKKELTNEQEQLATVTNMLKNIPANDTEQATKLKSMQQTHQRNIASLQKELGATKSTPKVNTPQKSSTPKLTVVNTLSNDEGKNIQMVQTSSIENKENLPMGLPNNKIQKINDSVESKQVISGTNALLTDKPESNIKSTKNNRKISDSGENNISESAKNESEQQKKINNFIQSYKNLFK